MRSVLPLALAALVASTVAAQPRRFTVAIVRLDGAIVPFAAYDAGRWVRAWPEADEAIDPSPTLADIPSVWRERAEPVPRAWKVWPSGRARPIEAQVNGIAVAGTHCQRQVVLTSDLRPVARSSTSTIGVAVDAAVPIGGIEEVKAQDAAWTTAAQIVRRHFSRMEAGEARTDRVELPRETPRPVERIRALYREAGSPRSPMYVIAEKRYRTPAYPEDPSCARVSVMTAWLVAAADGELALHDATMFVTNCDQKGVSTERPLAAVHVSDQVFWVMQERGYESESYRIAGIEPAEVRYPITVNGGGC